VQGDGGGKKKISESGYGQEKGPGKPRLRIKENKETSLDRGVHRRTPSEWTRKIISSRSGDSRTRDYWKESDSRGQNRGITID